MNVVNQLLGSVRVLELINLGIYAYIRAPKRPTLHWMKAQAPPRWSRMTLTFLMSA